MDREILEPPGPILPNPPILCLQMQDVINAVRDSSRAPAPSAPLPKLQLAPHQEHASPRQMDKEVQWQPLFSHTMQAQKNSGRLLLPRPI